MKGHRYGNGIHGTRCVLYLNGKLVITVGVLVAWVFVVECTIETNDAGGWVDEEKAIVSPLDNNGIGLGIARIDVCGGGCIGRGRTVFVHGATEPRGQRWCFVNVG